MRIILVIISVLVIANPSRSSEPEKEELINQLMQICFQHPEFHAMSSDLFKPENASEFEIEFYEKAAVLRSKITMLYLVEKRKKASQGQEVICIDNILNTWPG